MITLNLISPLQKKELKILRFFIIAKNSIMYLLLFLIAVAIILLLSKMILQNNFNRIVAEYSLNTITGKKYSQEIKQFNAKLKKIDSIQASYTDWTKYLLNFTNLTTSDVILFSIKVDKNTNKLGVQGRANTRQALLNYQKNLEQATCSGQDCDDCKCFEKVDIPLSSLLEKENIDFNILLKM